MDLQTILQLNALNQSFYRTVASSFSDTRQQPWSGWETAWKTVTNTLHTQKTVTVLDLGCGNGRFAVFCCNHLQPDQKLVYLGVDQEQLLLDLARETIADCDRRHQLELQRRNIVEDLLQKTPSFSPQAIDVSVAFGLFHHLPSYELRLKALTTLARSLAPTGLLVISFWQFTRNLALMKRQLQPQQLGIDPSQIESNDFFLTWEREASATRYCHLVNREEQDSLIADTGLQLIDRFSADGKSGQDNDYVILQPK